MGQNTEGQVYLPSLGEYWRSFWGISAGIAMVVLTLFSIGLDYLIVLLQEPLGDALQALNQPMFYQSLYRLLLFFCVDAINSLGLYWVVERCKIAWRGMISYPLTNMVKRYAVTLQEMFSDQFSWLGEGERSRFGSLHKSVNAKAVGQIVQDDVAKMMKILSYLTENLFRIGKLVMYSFILYDVSPALVLASGMIIPHYLLWVAWGLGGVTTVLGVVLGKPFFTALDGVTNGESRFRSVIMGFESRVSSILNTLGVVRLYEECLKWCQDTVLSRWRGILVKNISFKFVQQVISCICWVVPYILVAPMLFNGTMTLGGLFVVSRIFQKVFYNIQELVERLPRYLETSVSISRIHHLYSALDVAKAHDEQERSACKHQSKCFMSVRATVKEGDGNKRTVGFDVPNEEDLIGKVVHLYGENGLGKSQLLKTFSGERRATLLKKPKGYAIHALAQEPWRPDGKITTHLENGRERAMRVEDYLALGPDGKPHGKDLEPAYAWLDTVAFPRSRAAMEMDSLSPGQLQKVALARDLFVSEKKVILVLDEPFASMSAESSDKGRDALHHLVAKATEKGGNAVSALFAGKSEIGVLIIDHDHTPTDGDIQVRDITAEEALPPEEVGAQPLKPSATLSGSNSGL